MNHYSKTFYAAQLTTLQVHAKSYSESLCESLPELCESLPELYES